MKISDLKDYLATMAQIKLKLPDNTYVPPHFHVTEVGLITKHFVDCGGVKRQQKTASLQLWTADDYNHLLAPEKLLKILNLAKPILGEDDLEIEVEYQQTTISKFALDYDGQDFLLKNLQTACLAQDACGIAPTQMPQPNNCCNGTSCC